MASPNIKHQLENRKDLLDQLTWENDVANYERLRAARPLKPPTPTRFDVPERRREYQDDLVFFQKS